MTTIDAATLARLRRAYAPELPGGDGRCPFCGGQTTVGDAPMMARDGTDDGGWARWRCPRCTRTYVTAPGDEEVVALVTQVLRYRGSLDVAEKGLAYYSDVHLYERLGDEQQSRADGDEGAHARAAMDAIWEMCPERRWPEQARGEDWRLAVARVLRYHQEEAALLGRILNVGGMPTKKGAADGN